MKPNLTLHAREDIINKLPPLESPAEQMYVNSEFMEGAAMAKTAWIFSYKLRKNVSEEEFIKRTQRLHDEIISKAKGFISWEHYLQDDTWTDLVLWETEEDARNATIIGQGHAVTQEFYDCIRMQTCRALISTFIKKY